MPSEYLIIGADIVLTESNKELFLKGDVKSLVGKELKEVLDNSNYSIFNLDVPLVDQEKPIVKQGPNLIALIATITGFKALGINLFTLANNHILDQDE